MHHEGHAEYRICTRCVMDTTDADIRFDEKGVCIHCASYESDGKAFPQTAEARKRRLDEIIATIKEAGRGRPYDCLIGLSGGVDSTYVAYVVKKLGLRPLAVHVDNSWDSELAVKNIEHVVKKLGIDLHTHVLDWDQFKDIQLSFLRASVRDCEIPTDHAIVAVLLETAVKHKIGYILSGNNHATEGVLPISYSYGCFDWRYIKSVHRRHGTRSMKGFPHFSFLRRLYFIFGRRLRNIGILNYLEYDKSEAMRTIQNELGWVYYGGKHYESIYTRFYQAYILPRKFNVDKRRAHLSALVLSGLMTRNEALEELRKDPYPPDLLAQDKEYVAKKFGLSEADFEALLTQPSRYFLDYPTYYPMLMKTRGVVRTLKRFGLMPQRVGI